MVDGMNGDEDNNHNEKHAPVLFITSVSFFFFFLNDPAPPDISPFPQPAPLPISPPLEAQIRDSHQSILAHQPRQNGLHGGTVHLAITLFPIVTGARSESPAPAAPQGAANGAGTR